MDTIDVGPTEPKYVYLAGRGPTVTYRSQGERETVAFIKVLVLSKRARDLWNSVTLRVTQPSNNLTTMGGLLKIDEKKCSVTLNMQKSYFNYCGSGTCVRYGQQKDDYYCCCGNSNKETTTSTPKPTTEQPTTESTTKSTTTKATTMPDTTEATTVTTKKSTTPPSTTTTTVASSPSTVVTTRKPVTPSTSLVQVFEDSFFINLLDNEIDSPLADAIVDAYVEANTGELLSLVKYNISISGISATIKVPAKHDIQIQVRKQYTDNVRVYEVANNFLFPEAFSFQLNVYGPGPGDDEMTLWEKVILDVYNAESNCSNDLVTNIVCFISLGDLDMDARLIPAPSMSWLHHWRMNQSNLVFTRAGGQAYQIYTKFSLSQLYLRTDLQWNWQLVYFVHYKNHLISSQSHSSIDTSKLDFSWTNVYNGTYHLVKASSGWWKFSRSFHLWTEEHLTINTEAMDKIRLVLLQAWYKMNVGSGE
uniref:Uncharacterized protein n=1 Tax=Magallana gigas TaxID=29159 RepID=K1PJY3_MAGGI